jgi:hypothetical protein
MKKLLLSSILLVSVSIFSGCATKTTTSGFTCVGCEGLPDCVPGPYGSCPSVVNK